MAKIDYTYHKLLEKILEEGYDYKDESRDTMCKQISSYEFRHNMQLDGFPAITTKKLYWKGIVGELIWFLRGDTNIKYLIDNNIHIWNKDAYNYYLKHFEKGRGIISDKDSKSMTLDQFVESTKNGGGDWLSEGNLGRVYGAQWRKWTSPNTWSDDNFEDPSYTTEIDYLDQIFNLIQGIKDKPMSRRHIVTAWNPAELNDMALPPCHWSFEIIPRPLMTGERISLSCLNGTNCEVPKGDEKWDDFLDKWNIPKYTFDLKWHQRSVDTFLGLPFNIASYGLLMEIIGKLTNMVPNELVGDLSNVHIYHPHIEAVKTQLKNKPDKYWRPIKLKNLVEYNTVEDVTADVIDLMEIEHFQLKNYESYPAIHAEMLSPI